ncbi:hypothetical protein [Microbacterium sp. NPDC090003]|uniref:hypothetical protein n=1 Tax=Microbacterium sp. NPDC090003 TaxID=3364203 RepID=UPI003802ADC9
MNITLSRNITHPPDTQDRTVLHIPEPDELRALSLGDRLSLRIGLWLLRRAQRPRRPKREFAPAAPLFLHELHRSPQESAAILAYHLQRQMH